MIAELLSQWNAYGGLTSPPAMPIRLWGEGGRGVWIDNAWGPAVPYPAVDHGDGHQNYGYVRIKAAPEVLGLIPETLDCPEMASFLSVVNAADSPIESVGCEKGFFPGDIEGGPQVKLGSYIDVIFTDTALNDAPENPLQLASHLLEAVKGCERWWADVSAVLQRFRGVPGTVAPWGLMLRVSAYGRDEAEASKLWSVTLDRLGKAVKDLPRDFSWRGTEGPWRAVG
jgi:hypothetical protein